jgi:alkanesulfonate monooxygenase SsuD/methylene tetrahydromethanopterin reductase-like flavin-dependent oxidoreductase (luciferase family)
VIARNYEDIVKAWHGVMLVIDDKKGDNDQLKLLNTNNVWKKNPNLVISGMYDKLVKEIRRYVDIGVSYFTIHLPDLPSRRSLELFAENIIPHFRKQG